MCVCVCACARVCACACVHVRAGEKKQNKKQAKKDGKGHPAVVLHAHPPAVPCFFSSFFVGWVQFNENSARTAGPLAPFLAGGAVDQWRDGE